MPKLFPVPLTGAPLQRATTYQLHIVVPQPLDIVIGRLGHFQLSPGRYVYTGSARRSLQARGPSAFIGGKNQALAHRLSFKRAGSDHRWRPPVANGRM